MRVSKAALITSLTLFIPAVAAAQTLLPADPSTTGAIVEVQPNTTGNDLDMFIAPGSTAAGTVTTNSAAGGNANHPNRVIPNGSAAGGDGGGGH
ncbi:hypothetical protein ACRAWG_03215 [Methylobacterium sp. P31]